MQKLLAKIKEVEKSSINDLINRRLSVDLGLDAGWDNLDGSYADGRVVLVRDAVATFSSNSMN